MRYRIDPLIRILSLVLVLAGSAGAYMPSGPHVLDLMVHQVGSPRTLQVEWHRTIPQITPDAAAETDAVIPAPVGATKGILPADTTRHEPEAAIIETSLVPEALSETHWYQPPASIRTEARLPGGEAVFVTDGFSEIRIRDGRRVFHLPDRPEYHYLELLTYPDRFLLNRRLLALGIDTEVYSLGRFEGRPVYIIGAVYPDETNQPQLWIDKTRKVPLRWLETDADGRVLETRFSDWRQQEKVRFPHRITFYQDDVKQFELTVNTLIVNPAVAPDLFDVAAMERLFPEPADPDTPAGHQADSMTHDIDAIRETIEDFRKLYQ
ncbi:MAG: hypothetical protein CSA22_03120 [Deltaproteobacteria bacterium]|nr:MAG: hypothetical protein CSA22_03120 [Deltaproteobacteria bacterium]